MKRSPPRKKKDKPTGRRRIDGMIKDVAGMAPVLGETEKMVRSQVARGLLPHRRLGGRVIFVMSELEAFLKSLPGISPEQALENIRTRAETR